MRYPAGAPLPPHTGAHPRRAGIYRSLRAAILDGVLPPGERLPSTRQAAADYGVSRGVLEEVFAQLAGEGFLDRAVGRGTFVTGALARLAPLPPVPASLTQGKAAPSRRGRTLASRAACREPECPRAFNAGTADPNEFPWTTWQRLLARAHRMLGPAGLAFTDPRGLPVLRTAIASYLAQFRGLRCRPSQIIVFNSAQQAIHTLALALLNPGDPVWLEDPCYLGARAAFQLAGASIVPVPVDAEGLRVDGGRSRSPRARMAYVTPSNQYPSGAALSLDRRAQLLEWAARTRAWIVEDDYDGEFRYGVQPLTALYALEPSCVLHVGTFNKSMFASLRLAYAVVPEELIEPFANVRTQLDGFTPALPQLAMSLFMEEGYFSSHLRHMRAVYGTRRDQLTGALAPLASRGWTWPSNPAGMHLLLFHRDANRARSIAAATSLDLALLRAYRLRPARGDGLFLRYAALDSAAIDRGATTLLASAREL